MTKQYQGKRKIFDRSMYEASDKAAKEAALRFIKPMNYPQITTEETKDFDIVCSIDNKPHHLFEVEVKYSWKGDWNESWEEIRIPHRKNRLVKKWQELYPDSLFSFLVFRNDCKKAWYIQAEILLHCDVKEISNRYVKKGESFFHIPVQEATLVDIP